MTKSQRSKARKGTAGWLARKTIPNDTDACIFTDEQNAERERGYWRYIYWSCFWCRSASEEHTIYEYATAELHACEYGPKANVSKFVPWTLMETRHG